MADVLIRETRLVDLARGPVPVLESAESAERAEPVDVLVRDGVVERTGKRLRVPGPVQEHAAQGRWLIPGLWDAHVHLGQWTATRDRLDLTATRSVSQVQELVSARIAAQPTGAVVGAVVGWGHRCAAWPDQPSVAALDAVARSRPVVLISGDGHHAWLNTAGLDALGLGRRDGVVAENEWFLAARRLAELAAPGPADYRETMQHALAQGIVGVVDLEFGLGPDDWAARGQALLRIRAGCYPERLEEYAGLRTGDPLPGGDPLVRMGPLKVISDGSLNTRTAWCHAAYADAPGVGAPNLTEPELTDLLSRVAGQGLEAAVHAIGDAAVHQALAAFAASVARGSVEHVQMVAREDVAELARLGLRASVQPAHLLDDRDLTERCWPDRAERCFALRDLVDAGVPLALGSDAPVSPLDPWLAMAAAVHRSADERPAWHPEQSLTPFEALAASVDGHGTVRPGSPGDLALLDADPLDASGTPIEQAARLRAMTVAATWVDGELAYERP